MIGAKMGAAFEARLSQAGEERRVSRNMMLEERKASRNSGRNIQLDARRPSRQERPSSGISNGMGRPRPDDLGADVEGLAAVEDEIRRQDRRLSGEDPDEEDDDLDEYGQPQRRQSERWDPVAENARRGISAQPALPAAAAKEDRQPKLVPTAPKWSLTPAVPFDQWLLDGGVTGAHALYGVVQAVFSKGESPLGIVMDWSMPLPVIAGLLSGRPAKKQTQLETGLVLLQVNGRFLHGLARQPRAEVEQMLAERPLHLVFEQPLPLRFVGHVGEGAAQQPWQSTGPSQALAHSKSQGTVGMATTNATGFKTTNQSNSNCFSTGRSFLEQHPERAPIARFNIDMPNDLELPSLLKPGATGDISTHSSYLPRIASLTDKSFRTMMSSHESSRTSNSSWRGNRGGDRGHGRLPDRCYQHIVDHVNEIAKAPGPGPTSRWPLDHVSEYACRMSDLRLARKVREAYENGFQGRKRARPDPMHIMMYKNAPPRRAQVVLTDEVVWCDICGENVARLDCPGLFWYCRRCKRNGNRFEMCVSCHAIEVLQGEGKYTSEGRHPHYLGCEHRQIVDFCDLREAYPASPQLRRIFCDHCGELVRFREEDFSGKAVTIYVCSRCPKEHGLRFELCKKCALSLRDHGHGIRCLLDAPPK